MDLRTIDKLDKAKEKTLSSFAKLSLALLFIVVVFLWSYTSNGDVPNNTFLIIGAVFGAYMAMNIGANDVANNVGPAVGSKALTMFWAIVIAAVFEPAVTLAESVRVPEFAEAPFAINKLTPVVDEPSFLITVTPLKASNSLSVVIRLILTESLSALLLVSPI